MSNVIQWLMKRVLTEIVAMAGVDKFSGCDWRQITCHHSGETEASHQHNGSSVDIYISTYLYTPGLGAPLSNEYFWTDTFFYRYYYY